MYLGVCEEGCSVRGCEGCKGGVLGGVRVVQCKGGVRGVRGCVRGVRGVCKGVCEGVCDGGVKESSCKITGDIVS